MKYCGSLHNHTHYSNETLRDCINTVPGLIDDYELMEDTSKYDF